MIRVGGELLEVEQKQYKRDKLGVVENYKKMLKKISTES